MKNLTYIFIAAAWFAAGFMMAVAVKANAATWKVVELNRIDVQCYAYWRVARTYSADLAMKADTKRRMDAIVQHYTLAEWWAGRHNQRADLSEPLYYDFQQSVAEQVHRESDPLYSLWSGATDEEKNAMNAGCLKREAGIMRERVALSECMDDPLCTMRRVRNI